MELKKGYKISLTSGGYVTIAKELGRGGQGIVYLVDLNGEKKALKWYLNAPNDKFYKNLEHNIMNGAPSDAFLWPEYLTKKQNGSYGYVMKLRPQNYFEVRQLPSCKEVLPFLYCHACRCNEDLQRVHDASPFRVQLSRPE